MTKEPKNTTVVITSGTMVRAFLFLGLAAAIYFLWDLVLVLLMAIVIASAVEPATKLFARARVPRLPAVVTIYIGFALFLAGIFYFFIPPILDDAAGLIASLPSYISNGSDLLEPIRSGEESALPLGIQELTRTIPLTEIIENLRSALSNLSVGFLQVLSTIFGGVISLALIVVLSFYLSVQEDGIGNFLRIVTPVKHEAYIIDLWRRAQLKIGLWMQGQLVLAIIIGVLVYLGLTILGVKYALVLSVLAAVFELIPIFGPILAAIPAVILSFVGGGLTPSLMVVGLYVIIQQFENQLIYPLVVRKVVGVPPLLVILALIVGARFAGFLGIVLAVPLAAVFREYINDIQKGKIAEEKRLQES